MGNALAVRPSSLWSTWELELARVVLGYTSSDSYVSLVLSQIPACFITRWTHAKR